jgi:hypothetical protein
MKQVEAGVGRALLAVLALCLAFLALSLTASREARAAGEAAKTKFGIEYVLWHCPYSPGSPLAAPALRNRDAQAPDMTRIEETPGATTESKIRAYEDYLRGGTSFFWQSRPALGYYCIDDTAAGRAVARAHAELLRDAGMDFVFVDFTNNVLSPAGLFGAPGKPGCKQHEPYANWIARDRLVDGCIGFDFKTNDTRSIFAGFEVLLEEWSKVPGAPKIVPWVPLTRYNAPPFVFVRAGELRFPDTFESSADRIYALLSGGGHGDFKYKNSLLVDDRDGKFMLFNVVNNVFPEDKAEEKSFAARGFHVQNVWARFPDRAEVALDDPLLRENVLSPLGLKTLPAFDYEGLMSLALASVLKSADPKRFGGLSGSERWPDLIALISGDHARYAGRLKAASDIANTFFWHSVDTDKIWRWREPCRNPGRLKASQGSAPCEQRLSDNGAVVNVSSAIDWYHFTQTETSVGRMGGKVFERYFDAVTDSPVPVDYVLIGTWNQWLASQQRCVMNPRAPFQDCDGHRDCQGRRSPAPPVEVDYRNAAAIQFAHAPPKALAPLASGEQGSPIVCQNIGGGGFAWMANVSRGADGAPVYTRTMPDFHHFWIGDDSTDMEPGTRRLPDGEFKPDNSMYELMKKKILAYKASHK